MERRDRAPRPLGLSPRETALRLNTSISTVYRLLAGGKLRALKRGGSTLVLSDSLEAYIAGLPPYESRVA
jgi:excisionase family DNA binding protein